MIEPVPESWPVRNLGYQHMVMVAPMGPRGFMARKLKCMDWCWSCLGSMQEGGWIDQCNYVCFKDRDNAALFDMTWNT
jgi:hypothetical protein